MSSPQSEIETDIESCFSDSSSTTSSIDSPESFQSVPQKSTLLHNEVPRSVFVEALIDSSVLVIESIWSFAAESECFIERSMSLRIFVQETLKRSRVSYSTLQLALYYLILIKPFIYRTREHNRRIGNTKIPKGRSPQLRCGRRTFLAAIILASKFSQDRNYSLHTWSKISGLPEKELFDNELQFLKAVNWKLFVSHSIYQKWCQILFECSSSAKNQGFWHNFFTKLDKDCCYQSVSNDTKHYLPGIVSLVSL